YILPNRYDVRGIPAAGGFAPWATLVTPISRGRMMRLASSRLIETESHAPRGPNVRFRLTPRETSFYDMFAASADNIVTGSKLLMELLGADASARTEISERMRAAEHAGDDATHAIFHQLNSSFITPFDREDIYNLASSLDDIMDFMEEAVDLVVLYKVEELPKGIEQQIE